MKNKYGSLVEAWKVNLVVARAWMKGFRRDEIDDIQQVIIPVILRFEYDPAKANGATEATALTALIDKQLLFLKRGSERRRKREENHFAEYTATVNQGMLPDCAPDPEPGMALAIDVQEAVTKLSETEQDICDGLAHDEPRTRIADRLGISRYRLNRIIDRIREQFQGWGFDALVGNS